MADVFISYAREDRQWVEKLAAVLQTEGFSVWWDWDLLVGKRYRETIDTELQACKAAVVVWSQYSVRSDFVRDEAEEAQQRDILLPLLKDAIRPPAGFRQIQTADLSNWNGGGTDDELRRVIKGIAHMVRNPAAGGMSHPLADQSPPATTPTGRPEVLVPVSRQPEPPTVIYAKQAVAPPTPVAKASPPFRINLPALPFSSLPARSHPVWRYGAIGAVAIVALAFALIQIASIPWNTASTIGPGKAPPLVDMSATGVPTVGQATDTSGLNADVATAVKKAEASDGDARARAALALEQKKLADAASARGRQGGSSSAGMLNGHDAAGNSFAFAGEIADGTEQGVGAAAISNGSHYSGQWFGGIEQGLGVFTYSNGDQYAGEFDEDHESGIGAVIFADPTKGQGYSGQWAADAYNGYGVYYFKDGTRLEGLWHAGQVNGLGARFSPAGKLIEQGTYENSVLKHQ